MKTLILGITLGVCLTAAASELSPIESADYLFQSR